MGTRGQTGKRVLAVGAGTLLIGALGAGPAYAGSDHDDYYYSYSSDDCGDYRYSWYYEHGYDYDDHWDDRWDHDRDYWKDRDRDKNRDEDDEKPGTVTPPVVTPPVVTPPVDPPPLVVTPPVELPPLKLPEDQLEPPEAPTDPPFGTLSAPGDASDTSDSNTSTSADDGADSPSVSENVPEVSTESVDLKAAVTSLRDDPDPKDDDDRDHRWDGDHYSSGHYSYRVVVKCYEDTEKKHRWYEHRPVGEVEATKVRTVPKGGVDTGN